MRSLYAGGIGRLLTFLCAAAVAHAHAHIGVHAHASSSAAAGGRAGSKHSRRLHGGDRAPHRAPHRAPYRGTERSAGIDANYPLKHGRKCGVDSVTALEYNLTQSAILNNWLLRNSVRGSAAMPDSSHVHAHRATHLATSPGMMSNTGMTCLLRTCADGAS